MTKRLWKSGSLAIAATMMLSLLAPVAAAAPVDQSTPYTPEIQDTPLETPFGAFNRLPDVEPGVVGELPTSDAGLALAGVKDGSALVRLSVFATEKRVEVSAAGTTVLRVAEGREASTTVLVPVQSGHIPVSADADADVRVEVLASFAADTHAPGATVALQEPVTRADSANGLGLKSLSAETQLLSVVGRGGVPSQDVRAVYVTANVQLETAGTLTLSGQDLPLPAGQSIITTIVPSDADGSIEVSSSAPGDIRLDVTGWVVGAAQNMRSANSTGSYVPAGDSRWTAATASQENPTSVAVPGHSGRVQALALVSAESAEADNRAFVNVGDVAQGRSRGILVDPAVGALPQIELVEIASEDAAVSVRGEAVDVNVLALGDIVGESVPAAGSTSVGIEAPTEVDLALQGEIVLSGEVTSDAPVDKVDVYGNDTYIGTASVRYTGGEATWTFHTAAPESGEAKFTATAVARDGSTATAEAAVTVTLPEEDATVIAPDVVILDTEEVQAYREGNFLFSDAQNIAPGDVLVADASEHTPEGALGRVVSIQQTADGWAVETAEATLTDVFLQAEDESSMPAFTEGSELISPEDNQGFDVIDDGESNVRLVVDEEGLPATQDAHSLLSPSASDQAGASSSVMLKLSGNADLAITADKKTDLSYGNEATKDRVKHEVKREGGVSFSASFEASLGLDTALDIDIQWSWGIPSPHLSHFKSVFKGGVEAGYEASISGSYAEDISREITKIKGAPLTVMIGPVPVVFIPGATLSAVGNITAEVSFSYADSLNPSFEYGVEYKDGSWNPVRGEDQGGTQEPAQCVGWGSKVSASGDIAGQGGLELAADVKLFGFAGPKAVISAQGKSSFGIAYDGAEDKLTATTSRALVVGAGLNVDAKFKVIGVDFGTEWQLLGLERVFQLSEELPIQLDLCPDEVPAPNPDDDQEATESTLSGMVVDAATNEPIGGATIRVEDGEGEIHNTSSATDGSYTVTLAHGEADITARADGYIPYSRTVGVTEGTTKTHDIQLSHELESTQYRAVLTWGAEPSDLDSHLIGADLDNYYHVYYGDKRAYDDSFENVIAELDVDDVTSYGPETTTFDVTSSGDYTFFVHNYSGSPSLTASGAHVTLYQGTSKIADFDVPAGDDQLYWNVFRISNGELSVVNTLSDSPTANDSGTETRRQVDPGGITTEQLAEVFIETESGNK